MADDQEIKKWQVIFDTAIDGIIMINSNGLIQSVNQATTRIFQYDREELLGENVSILMSNPQAQEHDKYIRNYLSSRKPKIIGIGREVEGKKKDGTLFPLRLAVSEVKLSSDEVLFTGILHDLTEVKEVEKALKKLNQELEDIVEQRTQKLNEVINRLLQLNSKYENEIEQRKKVETALRNNEAKLKEMLDREKELNELKSRFLSMASHQFKTPLSTILSSASLISRYTSEEHGYKRQKHVDRIKSSVEHLDAILNDFLSLTKLEENQILLSETELPLMPLLEEISEDMVGQLKEGQQIEFQPYDTEVSIKTDPMVLKNVLLNLLSNASKYSPEDSLITIKTLEAQNHLILSIEDRGIGIPTDEQKHLFTRFYRATNAINIKGTGLGLHIVKQYLDRMNATIELESTEGKGSIFTIYLNKN